MQPIFKNLLLLFITLTFLSVNLHAQCPSGNLREVWYVKNDDPQTHYVYKYDMNANAETVYQIVSPPASLNSDVFFTDIGFAPNGDLYVVSFTNENTGSFWKVAVPTSGNDATITLVDSYPTLAPNALSFDLKGRLYMGFFGNSEIRTAEPGNYTSLSVWHDFGEGYAGGDFIIKDGFMYVLWSLNDETHLYRITIDANNNYVSHVDLGNISTLVGGSFLGFGMARISDNLYIAGTNSNLYIINSEDPLNVSALPPGLFSTVNGGELWGLTGRYESYGDFVNPPDFPQTTYALPIGETTIDLATITPVPAAPSGTTVAWFLDANLSSPVINPAAAPAGVYYAAFKRTADSYIPNDCFSPSIAVVVSNSLPVHFGYVSAILKNTTLFVEWNTLTENNNQYFDVEVSKDGKQFTSIGKVNSEALQGNSNAAINYSFSIGEANVWSLFGISLLSATLLLFIFVDKRNLKKYLPVLLIASGILWSACSKHEDHLPSNDGHFFVRIKQVDKDGIFNYSKIVEVQTAN